MGGVVVSVALDSCLPLRDCCKVRQTQACPSWDSHIQSPGQGQVPELQPPHVFEAQKAGSELVWTPSSPEAGPGDACLAPSSLSTGLGWRRGLRGRKGAGSRSGGLFEVSSSSWWQRVQLTN